MNNDHTGVNQHHPVAPWGGIRLVLKEHEAAQALGISVVTFTKGVNEGRYPIPREISKGCKGWPIEELQAALRQLPTFTKRLPPRNAGYGRAGKPKSLSSGGKSL